MNKENSKTNEPHKFVLNLSQKLDLRIKICSTKCISILHVEKYEKAA